MLKEGKCVLYANCNLSLRFVVCFSRSALWYSFASLSQLMNEVDQLRNSTRNQAA